MDLDDLKLNRKIAKQSLSLAESAGVADKEMIGFQKGYVRAYQEVIDDMEIMLETATHLETICLECNKVFKLVPINVKAGWIAGYSTITGSGHAKITITCRHCKTSKHIDFRACA